MKKEIPNILILIIEDDKYMNEIITEVLDSQGYTTDSAISAVEAVKKIKQEGKKYQVLVLDYNLEDPKGVTGLDILEMAIKNNPETKGIMVSAFSQQLIRKNSRLKGIYKFLDKPFLITDLIDSVNEVTDEIIKQNGVHQNL